MSLMPVDLTRLKGAIDEKILRMLQIVFLVTYSVLMLSIPDAPGLKFFGLLYLIAACATADKELYQSFTRGFARGFGMLVGSFGALMLLVGLLSWEWEAIRYGLIIAPNLFFLLLDELADESGRENSKKLAKLTIALMFSGTLFMAWVLEDYMIKLFSW